MNVRVVAASSDAQDKAAEMAEKTGLPIGHGVDRATADGLGAYWEDRRGFIQPSEFLLAPDNTILNVSYSDGPLARMDAFGVKGKVVFEQKQKAG